MVIGAMAGGFGDVGASLANAGGMIAGAGSMIGSIDIGGLDVLRPLLHRRVRGGRACIEPLVACVEPVLGMAGECFEVCGTVVEAVAGVLTGD